MASWSNVEEIEIGRLKAEVATLRARLAAEQSALLTAKGDLADAGHRLATLTSALRDACVGHDDECGCAGCRLAFAPPGATLCCEICNGPHRESWHRRGTYVEPGTCTRCHGTGMEPGTNPAHGVRCPACRGSGRAP